MVQDGKFFVFFALFDEVTIDGTLSTVVRMFMLSGNQLQIFLPSFQRKFLLDLTFAILVQFKEKNGGNNTPLVIGLTIGLVGGLLVTIVLGGLIVAEVVAGLNFW